MVQDIITLGLLVVLQAVLGFDNLLYISLESKRAPEDKRQFVRNLGIGIAIVARIGLLFVVINLLESLTDPWFHVEWEGVFTGHISGEFLIVFAGGAFILYTALKEIWHMISFHEHKSENEVKTKQASVGKVITMIVTMNLVFSFDSILSAKALTDELWIMATAIIISGVLMMWLAGKVSSFLAKNRMYEVLGLFILFLVGVMLLSEAAHKAHIQFFGHSIEAMSKATFYFVIVVLVLIDIVQGRYKKKIARQAAEMDEQSETSH